MGTFWARAKLAQRHFKAGRLGDAAAYKATALDLGTEPAIRTALASMEHPFPAIDLDELSSLAPASFGRACADHMRACRLTPFVLSPEVAEELADEGLAVRYVLLHDVFHVLLDFDTSLVGELGVWSFVGAQNYCRMYRRAASMARWLYPWVVPHRFFELRRADRVARGLAASARPVIAEPVTQWFDTPLVDVRRRLGLPEGGSGFGAVQIPE